MNFLKSGHSAISILMMMSLVFFSPACGKGGSEAREKDSRTNAEKDPGAAAADYFEMLLKPFRPLEAAYGAMDREAGIFLGKGRPSTIMRGADEMRARLGRLQELTRSTADKIAEMPAYQGDSSIRDAVLDYLDYLEEYADYKMPELIRMLEDYAARYDEIEQGELDSLNEFIGQLNRDAEEQGKLFKDAQAAFAGKYNFTLLPGTRLR